MNLRIILGAMVLFGLSFLLLWFLRFLGIIGGTANVLISSLMIISLILFGLFIGITFMEKRIGIKGIVVNFLLGLTVLFLSPMIGVVSALLISNMLFLNFQFVMLITVIISGFFGVSFIWFVYWLKRKGHLRFTEID